MVQVRSRILYDRSQKNWRFHQVRIKPELDREVREFVHNHHMRSISEALRILICRGLNEYAKEERQ